MNPRVRSPGYLLARTVTAVLLATVALCAPNAAEGVAGVAVEQLLDRNDVESRDLDPRTSTGVEVWLVLGSDARDGGFTPTSPATTAAGVSGQRADLVSLWILDRRGSVATVVSLPRDLRVEVAGHGEQQLAVSYAYGPGATLKAVQDLTGLPIHHVAELDFTGVIQAVDVLGGVELYVSKPARDIATGLRLDQGLQRLTGADALAWTRSRKYEEYVDGAWVHITIGDLNRIERQHRLLAAVVDAARKAGPGITTKATLKAVAGHFRVDKSLSTEDLFLSTRFLLEQVRPNFLTIPVQREKPLAELMSPFPPGHLGGDSYLILRPDATRVLSDLAAIVQAPPD
jgi:LCP family protein required for cell wall assembly